VSQEPGAQRGLTPSQTVGPFLAIGLPWPDGSQVVPVGTPGAIVIVGRVLDGAGEPVLDALVETWQAAPDGSFPHSGAPPASGPAGRAGPGGFRGFGRSATDAAGRWEVVTLRPGRVPGPDGGLQAPHLDVSVFARGLLDRVVTRIYFPDEQEANAADPVLAAIPDQTRRATLIARPGDGHDRLRFDIQLQGRVGGEHSEPGERGGRGGRGGLEETVFFDV
jgi:protocatechuate 3,4-dioxygenase, alpha subunit